MWLVPMGDDRPEFLRFLSRFTHCLEIRGEFGEGGFTTSGCAGMRAPWRSCTVGLTGLLFDRSLDKSLFRRPRQQGRATDRFPPWFARWLPALGPPAGRTRLPGS